MITRSQFTEQQRMAAVLQSDIVGIKAAAKIYGVTTSAIRRWRDKAAEKAEAEAPVAQELVGPMAKALALPWPGDALRVCADHAPGTIKYRLVPKGSAMPKGAIPTRNFRLTDTAPARPAYSDGFLNAHARALQLHDVCLDAVSVAIAGNDMAAANMIYIEVARRLGADMSEVEQCVADRVSAALIRAGLYSNAKTNSAKATIAALVGRDLKARAQRPCETNTQGEPCGTHDKS